MTKIDLRVNRTLTNIHEAFFSMLSDYPIEKITIKALAEAAGINKGTFYLHYQDIIDLYKKMIMATVEQVMSETSVTQYLRSDPEAFLHRVLLQIKQPRIQMQLERLQHGSLTISFTQALAEAVKTQVLLSLETPLNELQESRLDVIANGIAFLIIHPQCVDERVRDTFATMIKGLLPIETADDNASGESHMRHMIEIVD